MYLHLGQDTVIKTNEIIGIFDMDTSTLSRTTCAYLAQCEKKGRVVNVSMELPKSFVLCRKMMWKRHFKIAIWTLSVSMRKNGS